MQFHGSLCIDCNRMTITSTNQTYIVARHVIHAVAHMNFRSFYLLMTWGLHYMAVKPLFLVNQGYGTDWSLGVHSLLKSVLSNFMHIHSTVVHIHAAVGYQ